MLAEEKGQGSEPSPQSEKLRRDAFKHGNGRSCQIHILIKNQPLQNGAEQQVQSNR